MGISEAIGKEVTSNSLIHGSWFGIGKGEKSCHRALWRLILREKEDVR